MLPSTEKFSIWQSSGALCLSLVNGWDGAPITAAEISSIAWAVYDIDARTQVSSGSLIPSLVLSDTPKFDAGWPYAEAGYNFAFCLPHTCFPNGGRRYRAEFVYTPISGEPFADVFANLYAQKLFSGS